MRRSLVPLVALFALLLFAGAATAAETSLNAAPAEAATAVAPSAPVLTNSTPAIEADAALCQFLEAAKTNVLEQATAGYWCPPGHWYCQRNSQCSGFCGIGQDQFAVCEFGCCMCAG